MYEKKVDDLFQPQGPIHLHENTRYTLDHNC